MPDAPSDPEPEPEAPPPAADAEVDALGLLCPLPVLRARKRLAGMAAGEALAVLADDPAAAIDMPHFCAEQGHVLLWQGPEAGGGRRYVIRKGPGPEGAPGA